MPRVRVPIVFPLFVLVLGVIVTPLWLGLIGWGLFEVVFWIAG